MRGVAERWAGQAGNEKTLRGSGRGDFIERPEKDPKMDGPGDPQKQGARSMPMLPPEVRKGTI